MGDKATSSALNNKVNEENQSDDEWLSFETRVARLAITSLPPALLRIVGEYLSKEKNDPVKYALIGEQPITLALSQYFLFSKIAPCWYMGFLPPDCQWQGLEYFKVDESFKMNDHERCLKFVASEDSSYCRVVIDVLVLSLDMGERNRPFTFDDLRRTLDMLHEHLSRVKHVVISVSAYDSFCFSFKNIIDKATGLPLPCEHQQALRQVIDDLGTCWNKNHTFDATELFAFYFKSKVKPASDMYLVKCIMLLNHEHGYPLFEKEASCNISKKIMWVYHAKHKRDLLYICQNATRLCHAINFEECSPDNEIMANLGDRWKYAFCFQDNPIVERIVIDSSGYFDALQLPRPREPLTDISTFSALMEITLKGKKISLHLTQLNNGYFPHLAFLTIMGARISGHLDSQRVPSLKTLFIGPENKGDQAQHTLNSLVHERVRVLLCCGLPWQLVATKSPRGWSLASYETPITNPQEDSKEESSDSPHWLPLIKELLLVGDSKENADEWQLQLNGCASLEAATDDYKDRILLWSPRCVEKITAFSTAWEGAKLDFSEVIPGETRILSSLECHRVSLTLNGAVLQDLQSLEMNIGDVEITGSFPQLKMLSLHCVFMVAEWELDAPLLSSFNCPGLHSFKKFVLNPKLLPRLSFLHSSPRNGYFDKSLQIAIDDDDVLGLSRVKHVVFYNEEMLSSIFNQCRFNHVSHLELAVDASQLPTSWHEAVWYCETLKIFVTASSYKKELPERKLDVVLPTLPLVKKLIVTEENCSVLLNKEMPDLIDCTVPSCKSLGRKLRCPALRYIRFSEKLSVANKKKCLNRSTYLAFGAQPTRIYFDANGDVRSIDWDVAVDEHHSFSLMKLLIKGGDVLLLALAIFFLLCCPVDQLSIPFYWAF